MLANNCNIQFLISSEHRWWQWFWTQSELHITNSASERERWQSSKELPHCTLCSSSRFNFFFSAPATGPSPVSDWLKAVACHSRSSWAHKTSFLQICWETLNPILQGFVEEALNTQAKTQALCQALTLNLNPARVCWIWSAKQWSKNTNPYRSCQAFPSICSSSCNPWNLQKKKKTKQQLTLAATYMYIQS